MKKLFVTISVACACAFASFSQTNTAPTLPTDNGYTSVPGLLTTTWDTLVGQGMTNLAVAAVATYTPSLKEWGGGVVIMRNLPLGGGISTGIGLGLDYYARNFYAVSGQLSLQADVKPFAAWGGFFTNVVMTPFTFVGLGTPMGGDATTPGRLETIVSAGATFHIMKLWGGDLGVTGMYGTREGLGEASGAFYGGGLVQVWKF